MAQSPFANLFRPNQRRVPNAQRELSPIGEAIKKNMGLNSDPQLEQEQVVTPKRVTHFRGADGSLIPIKSPSGKNYLVKDPGARHHRDPETGDPVLIDEKGVATSIYDKAPTIKENGKIYAAPAGYPKKEIGDDPDFIPNQEDPKAEAARLKAEEAQRRALEDYHVQVVENYVSQQESENQIKDKEDKLAEAKLKQAGAEIEDRFKAAEERLTKAEKAASELLRGAPEELEAAKTEYQQAKKSLAQYNETYNAQVSKSTQDAIKRQKEQGLLDQSLNLMKLARTGRRQALVMPTLSSKKTDSIRTAKDQNLQAANNAGNEISVLPAPSAKMDAVVRSMTAPDVKVEEPDTMPTVGWKLPENVKDYGIGLDGDQRVEEAPVQGGVDLKSPWQKKTRTIMIKPDTNGDIEPGEDLTRDMAGYQGQDFLYDVTDKKANKVTKAKSKEGFDAEVPDSWVTPEAITAQENARTNGTDRIYQDQQITVEVPPSKLDGEGSVKVNGATVGKVRRNMLGLPEIELASNAYGTEASPSYRSNNPFTGAPEYREVDAEVIEANGGNIEAARREWKDRRLSSEYVSELIENWSNASDEDRRALMSNEVLAKAESEMPDARWLYQNGYVSLQQARQIDQAVYGREQKLPDIRESFEAWKQGDTPAARKVRELEQAGALEATDRQLVAANKQLLTEWESAYMNRHGNMPDFSPVELQRVKREIGGEQVTPLQGIVGGIEAIGESAIGSAWGLVKMAGTASIGGVINSVRKSMTGKRLPEADRLAIEAKKRSGAQLTDEEKRKDFLFEFADGIDMDPKEVDMLMTTQKSEAAFNNMVQGWKNLTSKWMGRSSDPRNAPIIGRESVEYAASESPRQGYYSQGAKDAAVKEYLEKRERAELDVVDDVDWLKEEIDKGTLTPNKLKSRAEAIKRKAIENTKSIKELKKLNPHLSEEEIIAMQEAELSRYDVTQNNVAGVLLASYRATRDEAYLDMLKESLYQTSEGQDIVMRAARYAEQNGLVSETDFLGVFDMTQRGIQLQPNELVAEAVANVTGLAVMKALTPAARVVKTAGKAGVVANKFAGAANKAIKIIDKLRESKFAEAMRGAGAAMRDAGTSIKNPTLNKIVQGAKALAAETAGEGIQGGMVALTEEARTPEKVMEAAKEEALGGFFMAASHAPLVIGASAITRISDNARRNKEWQIAAEQWNKRNPDQPIQKEDVRGIAELIDRRDINLVTSRVDAILAEIGDNEPTSEQINELSNLIFERQEIESIAKQTYDELEGVGDKRMKSFIKAGIKALTGQKLDSKDQQAMAAVNAAGEPLVIETPKGIVFTDAGLAEVAQAAPGIRRQYFPDSQEAQELDVQTAPTQSPDATPSEPKAATSDQLTSGDVGASEQQQNAEVEKAPTGTVDEGAHSAATSPTNDLKEPTEAQKKAGNYAVGRTNISGLNISIENPAGSTRSGTTKEGRKWSTTMKAHYGYMRGTVGADGDQIDVFVKEGTPTDFNGDVFVIPQHDPKTGKFDEHKVMIGYANQREAENAYLEHYDKEGQKGFRRAHKMSMADLVDRVKSGKLKKPSTRQRIDSKDQPYVAKAEATEAPAAPEVTKEEQPATDTATTETQAAEEEAPAPAIGEWSIRTTAGRKLTLPADKAKNSDEAKIEFAKMADRKKRELLVIDSLQQPSQLKKTPVQEVIDEVINIANKVPARRRGYIMALGKIITTAMTKHSQAIGLAFDGIVIEKRKVEGGGMFVKGETLHISPSTFIESMMMLPESAIENFVNGGFLHEMLHPIIERKVSAKQAEEFWQGLKPEVQRDFLLAYEGENTGSLVNTDVQRGYEYLRAIMEKRYNARISEELFLDTQTSDKIKAAIRRVVKFMRDIIANMREGVSREKMQEIVDLAEEAVMESGIAIGNVDAARNAAAAKSKAEPIGNSAAARYLLNEEFGPLLRKLRVDMEMNYVAPSARYVVSTSDGKRAGYIEVNPVKVANWSPGQAKDAMREELIHAVEDIALLDELKKQGYKMSDPYIQSGQYHIDFYEGVYNMMSKEQIEYVKAIYTSHGNKKHVIGSEFRRMLLQNEHYKGLTEAAFAGKTAKGKKAIEAIAALLKIALQYLKTIATSNTKEAKLAAAVYEASRAKLQKLDPRGEAKLSMAAPQKPEGKQAGWNGGKPIKPEFSREMPKVDANKPRDFRKQPMAAPLIGLPTKVKIPGMGEREFGPWETAKKTAEAYMKKAGLNYDPPRTYAKVNKARAERIAAEFDKMKHEPQNLAVAASYRAMIDETLAQWEAIKATGLKVEPIPAGMADPYAASPRLAQIDAMENNHLWFFPTDNGFGNTVTGFDPKDNPLFEFTGEVINGHKMRANDVFRIVHDYFGHFKEGVGFRADGEENAWRQHMAMYSPLARGAMTTETRGQNSWLNFGPFGEKNRTARTEDTVFADQKIGLMPEWTWSEGAGDEMTNAYAESAVRDLGNLSFEEEGGDTMNLDGSKYTGGGVAIPVLSKNFDDYRKLKVEDIAKFINPENVEYVAAGGSVLKAGIYKFPNSNRASVDLNIIAPRDKRDIGIQIAADLDQESVFDLDTFENVKTGKTGESPRKPTVEELKEIANKLSDRVQPMAAPFVTQAMDMEYMNALKAGDMAKAQQMVDEAAKTAGFNSPKVYHGTQAKFNVFDESKIGSANGRSEGAGFYFTTDKTIAEGYQRNGGNVISAYLKIRKALDYNQKPFTALQMRKLLKSVALTEAKDSFEGNWKDGFLSNYGDTYSKGIDSIVAEAAGYFADEKSALDQIGKIIGSGVDPATVNEALASSLGYDAFYSKGFSGEGKQGGDIYVATSSNQIKSADPVTYDDAGNVIPLSKRFNPESNSILYMNAPQLELDLGRKADLFEMRQRNVKRMVEKSSSMNPEAIKVEYIKDGKNYRLDEKGLPIAKPVEYNLADSFLAKTSGKGIKGAKRMTAYQNALAEKLIEFFDGIKDQADVMAGREWYRVAREKLEQKFGKDKFLFAQLLAATSARTPVRQNFEQAIDSYNGIKTGRFNGVTERYLDAMKSMEEGTLQFRRTFGQRQMGETVTPKTFREWLDSEEIMPRRENGKKYNANSIQVLNVIAGVWREKLGGPKTAQFSDNLSGASFEATIDVWAARTLHRLSNERNGARWRILPASETGVNNEDFDIGQKAFAIASKKLGMNPDDLQGILWFAEKKYWTKKGWTKAVGSELSDFSSLLDFVTIEGGKKVLRIDDGQGMLGLDYEPSAQSTNRPVREGLQTNQPGRTQAVRGRDGNADSDSSTGGVAGRVPVRGAGRGPELIAADEEMTMFMASPSAPAYVEPGFYSELQRVITDSMPNSVSATKEKVVPGKETQAREIKDKTGRVIKVIKAQKTPDVTVRAKSVREQIENIILNAGVTHEEIKWSGILPWLNGRMTVTKEEVLDYLKNEGSVKFKTTLIRGSGIEDASSEDRYKRAIEAYDTWIYDQDGDIRGHKITDGEHDLFDKWAKREITTGHLVNNLRTTGFDEEQLEMYLVNHRSLAKYESYTLPGGRNYREVVLELPPIVVRYDRSNTRIATKEESQGMDHSLFWFIKSPDNLFQIPKSKYKTEKDALDYVIMFKQPEPAADKNYKSKHFDALNYVAHMRLNERPDSNGDIGLFIEELQSDRHQEGRKKGYVIKDVPFTPAEIRQREDGKWGFWKDGTWVSTWFGDSKYQAEIRQRETYTAVPPASTVKEGIPDAPYRTSWPIQLFKRALHDAVSNGHKWIGWTTGETQNDRFSLEKQIQAIDAWRMDDGRRLYDLDISIEGKKKSSYNEIPESRLEEFVGKDMAEKIINDPNVSDAGVHYSGLDLKVGGKGMIKFYDKILVNLIGDYVKQWNAKVTTSQINEGQNKIWRVEITPEMRKSVSDEGQALFMSGPRSESTETAKDTLEAWMKMAPTADEIRMLREKALSEKTGSRTVGDPARAGLLDSTDAENRERDAIIAFRKNNEVPEKVIDWMKAGREYAESDPNDVADSLLENYYNGVGYDTPEQIFAAAIVVSSKFKEARLKGDSALLAEAQALAYADGAARSENARVMRAMVDPHRSPEQRMHEFFAKLISTPSESQRVEIENAPSPLKQEREIADLKARIEELEKQVANQTSQKTEEQKKALKAKLKEAQQRKNKKTLIQEYTEARRKAVAAALAREGLTEEDIFVSPEERLAAHDSTPVQEAIAQHPQEHRDAINYILRGYSHKDIATMTGLGVDAIATIHQEFRQKSLRSSLSKWVKKGNTLFDTIQSGLKKVLGLSMAAPAQYSTISNQMIAEVEIERQLNVLCPTAKNVNSGKLMAKIVTRRPSKGVKEQEVQIFVPFSSDDFRSMYRVARAISSSQSNAFDKVYEYWISAGLLSGPETHWANVAGNFIMSAHHMLLQKPIEAALNFMTVRDPKAAQIGEFKHMIAGVLPGIREAFTLAALAWDAEADPIGARYMNETVDLTFDATGNLSKVGSMKGPAIAGAKGRVFRFPVRFLLAMDAFFKSITANIEVGARAYRLGKMMQQQGLLAKDKAALESFIQSEIATPGSQSWELAIKTSKELAFQGDNVFTLVAGSLTARNQDMLANSMSNEIKKAMAKGDKMEIVNKKISRYGIIVTGFVMKFIFPFVKTPTNILAVGARKAGFGSIPLIFGLMPYVLAKGAWNKINKKSFSDGNMTDLAVVWAAEQVQAFMMWSYVWSLAEGDDNDNEKPYYIVGSRPYGVSKPGDKEEAYRRFGGTQVIMVRNDDGSYTPWAYGRYEPFATVLTAVVDTMREIKNANRLNDLGVAGGSVIDIITNSVASFASQLQDKSFFQGFANVTKAIDKVMNKQTTDLASDTAKGFFQGFVPNIVRQPIRNIDPIVRDSKKAEFEYAILPMGRFAEPIIDYYGRTSEKLGYSATRILVREASKPQPINKTEETIDRWNLENPDKAFRPGKMTRSSMWVYGPNNEKRIITDPKMITEFETEVGREIFRRHSDLVERYEKLPDNFDELLSSAANDARKFVRKSFLNNAFERRQNNVK